MPGKQETDVNIKQATATAALITAGTLAACAPVPEARRRRCSKRRGQSTRSTHATTSISSDSGKEQSRRRLSMSI
jgi:hypothetical protein